MKNFYYLLSLLNMKMQLYTVWIQFSLQAKTNLIPFVKHASNWTK